MLSKIEGGWEVLPRKADMNKPLPCKRAYYGNESHVKLVYCTLTQKLCAHIVYVPKKRIYWVDEERIKICPGMINSHVTDSEIQEIQKKVDRLEKLGSVVREYLERFEMGRCPPTDTDCIPESSYCNKKLCWAEAFRKLFL